MDKNQIKQHPSDDSLTKSQLPPPLNFRIIDWNFLCHSLPIHSFGIGVKEDLGLKNLSLNIRLQDINYVVLEIIPMIPNFDMVLITEQLAIQILFRITNIPGSSRKRIEKWCNENHFKYCVVLPVHWDSCYNQLMSKNQNQKIPWDVIFDEAGLIELSKRNDAPQDKGRGEAATFNVSTSEQVEDGDASFDPSSQDREDDEEIEEDDGSDEEDDGSDEEEGKKSERGDEGSDKKKEEPTEESSAGRKQYISYHVYIYKVLKQVHPDTGISVKAMAIMNSFVNDVFDRIALEAGRLARYNQRNTISSREIQTAVRLIFPGELAKHAVSEGTKAVTKYMSSLDPNEREKTF